MNPPEAEEKTIEQEISEAIDTLPEELAPERDEKGRFVPKAEPDPVEPPAGAAPDVKTVEADEPVEAIPDKFALPPNYAKKAIREKWGELSPEVRQELHERESDFHKQLTRFDEERNFGRQIKQVVAPYEGFIKSLGAEPVQAFDYLIKTDYALRTAPPEQRKAMFLQAAKDYGVTLSDEDFSQAQYQQADPRIETLAQRLERLEFEQRSAMEQQQLQEQRSLEQQITDFASRPDKPFFDRVSPLMAALLQSGQAEDLEEAYDKAVYADPETRALQLTAQQQTEQSQRQAQLKAAADKAKAASASVTGAPGQAIAASSPNSAGSLEDDIRAAYQTATGRI